MTKFVVWMWLLAGTGAAQSLGGAGTIKGSVRDATDAPLAGALVEVSNPLTGFRRAMLAATDGTFVVNGILPNTYSVRVSLPGFLAYSGTISVRAAVPMELSIRLEIAGQQTSITVEGG